MTIKNMPMARVVSLLGVFIGCGMLAVAFVGTPQASNVEAREADVSTASPLNCHVEEVMIDEGYGVSAKEQRRICAAAD